MGRWSYRWSPDDFESNKREGIDGEWPIGYDDIAPWYDYVENDQSPAPYLPDIQTSFAALSRLA